MTEFMTGSINPKTFMYLREYLFHICEKCINKHEFLEQNIPLLKNEYSTKKYKITTSNDKN